jgi:hypothetical protein
VDKQQDEAQLGVQHQNIAFKKQGVENPHQKKKKQTPNHHPRAGVASPLQPAGDAKQQAEQAPEFGFEKNMLNRPSKLIRCRRPGTCVSTESKNIDQKDPKEGKASQDIYFGDSIPIL